jgi:hypothetical protein
LFKWILVFFIAHTVIHAEIFCLNHRTQPIDRIEVTGLQHTKKQVVEREFLHKAGDLLDCAQLKSEKASLQDIGIFSDVQFVLVDSMDYLILQWNLVELPAYVPLIAVRKSDQDGLLAGPALTALNLWGQGVRLDLFYRTTMHPQWFRQREVFLAIHSRRLGHLPLEYNGVWIHTEGWMDILGYKEVSDWMALDLLWRTPGYWGYIAALEVLDVKSDKSEYLASGKHQDASLQPALGLVWDARNQKVNPDAGVYAEARLLKNAPIRSGSSQFWGWLVDLRWYARKGKNQTLFSALWQERRGKIAPVQYLFTGGANSLRGAQAGSIKSQGELLLNGEYRYLWVEQRAVQWLGIHGFIGVQPILGVDWVQGLGVEGGPTSGWSVYAGLHLVIPGVERARLELAHNSIRAHLAWNTGLYEKVVAQRWRTR